MTHYLFKKITAILEQLTCDSESFRALLTRPPITKDGNDKIWNILQYEDGHIADMMDDLENRWVDYNQGQADRGLGATDDICSLVGAMIEFMSFTNVKIEGRGVLYENTRARVSKWMDQAGKWYQDIKKASTKINVKVDRERLKKCFVGDFTKERPMAKRSLFDYFYDDIEKMAPTYTTTDIGRVAYQIWKSPWASTVIRNWKFSRWMREFCLIFNVPVPKDIAPTRYKTSTKGTNYSRWLKKPTGM